MKPIHIGKEIEKVFRKSGLKVTEFGRLIGSDRQKAYDVFKRKSIQTSALLKISQVLNNDFFKVYSRRLKIK
jgi:hypothetical protein